MKTILFILIVQCINESNLKRTTLSQKERIKILRQKIHEEIRSKSNPSSSLRPFDIEDSSTEAFDYKLAEHLPITPILERTVKYNRALTTLKFDSNNSGNATIDKSLGDSKGNGTLSQLRSQKKHHKKKSRVRKPLEIFYRRIYNKDMFDSQLEWVHCQDIITPFLIGAKLNISNPKRHGPNDPTVVRLLTLLKVNTSTYSREDIYSILYQISNLNLRFFRWDVPSMQKLFNIIMKEKRHTFGNLKNGLHDLFNNWRLDFSNSTTLLRQARIFRPPCVHITNFDGSTKLPKVTKYPKRLVSTTPCDYDDDDCKDE